MVGFFKKLGLFVNIIVCLLLLLSCYGTRFNDGDYWFMGLFALATVYFLVAVIFFLLLWLFVKQIYLLPGIVTLILCFNPLKQVLPLRFTPGFTEEKNKQTIRVMSWNVEHFNIIHHKEKPDVKNEMIELIKKYQPDIACFQEMVAGDSLKHTINYIGEFPKKLGMKYYYYSYKPAYDFDFRHHFGNIIFSRYPLINQTTLEYKPYDYNSVFQYADVVKGRDTFRIFNIHLQSLRFSPDNMKYISDPTQSGKDNIKESKSILAKFRKGFIRRYRQTNHVRKVMNQSSYPIILCGDFNDVPNSYAYNTIGTNLQNAFTECGYGIGATYSGILPTLRIDNIFCDTLFEVKQFTRIKKRLSDHYPIIADLEITQ